MQKYAANQIVVLVCCMSHMRRCLRRFDKYFLCRAFLSFFSLQCNNSYFEYSVDRNDYKQIHAYIWLIFDTATGTRSQINAAAIKKKRRSKWKNQSHVLIDQWLMDAPIRTNAKFYLLANQQCGLLVGPESRCVCVTNEITWRIK